MTCDIPPRPSLTPAHPGPIIECVTGFAMAGVDLMCTCCRCTGATGLSEGIG